MSENEFHVFRYDHAERDFVYVDELTEEITSIIQGDITTIPEKLTEIGYDALLVLDYNTKHWYLGYSESLGIVGERTSRRQADSIVRSGFNLADGYWVKEPKFPLQELSDPNLGDLWKTVQNKYLESDLGGLELDEETGIPKQIKERAERLKSAGHEDALTEAKLELEEAENRKKAMKRSDTKTKKAPAKKKKTTKKKATGKVTITSSKEEKEKPEVKKAPAKKKKTTKKKATGKVTQTSTKKEDKPSKPVTSYMEISELVEYVKGGFTEIICKGNITESTGKSKSAYLSLSQSNLSEKEWTNVALFLSEGDIIEVTTSSENEVTYATSLKV